MRMRTETEPQFTWTAFYEEFTKNLLDYKDNRPGLVNKFQNARRKFEPEIGRPIPGLDGLQEIDPFTVLATFNRGENTPPANRNKIAAALGDLLEVSITAPERFDGIPTVDNRKSWFFDAKSDVRRDMGYMWDVFEAALDLKSFEDATEFIEVFNRAIQVVGVKRKMTFGLYWIRPDMFVALDKNNKKYVEKYGLARWPFEDNLPLRSGERYVDLCHDLSHQLKHPKFIVSTIQELSQAAWDERDEPNVPPPSPDLPQETGIAEVVPRSQLPETRGNPSPPPNGGAFVPRDPPETTAVAGPRAVEAEDWVEAQLLRERESTVERFGSTHHDGDRLSDNLRVGADFLVKKANSNEILKFVEVKSSRKTLPNTIQLTASEFLRARQCVEDRIPYELWIVSYDAESAAFKVKHKRIIEHFEQQLAEFTEQDFASFGVQLRYPN